MVGKWFGFEREEVYEEGSSSLEFGDFEEASKAFEACRQDDPNDPRIQPLLVQCYEELAKQALVVENYLEAEGMAENAIVIDSTRVDLHFLAAKGFRSLQKFALEKFPLKHASLTQAASTRV
jgi:tetratricopeptide (TPR) repeat protein